MEVINPRSALLSNFEVLSLLRELESDQLAETRAAIAVKKEQAENESDLSTLPNLPPQPIVCENLRTIEFETIAYLSAEYQPTLRQTPQGIRKLTKALAPYGLTKAEKLQIVNLAPTEPIELYVIVEELEDRLSDQMGEILEIVRSSLAEAAVEKLPDAASDPAPETFKEEDADGEIVEEAGFPGEVLQEEDDSGMMEFVDEGAFAGDLDAEEDE